MITNDPYMDAKKSINRLVAEWTKYGKLVIAYDFDGTVYDFHKEGFTFKMVPELLRECKEQGAHLIVYTANSDIEFIKNYLDANNIPFDYINENPPELNLPKGGKLYYNILLDDRAGLNEAYLQLQTALMIMKGGRL